MQTALSFLNGDGLEPLRQPMRLAPLFAQSNIPAALVSLLFLVNIPAGGAVESDPPALDASSPASLPTATTDPAITPAAAVAGDGVPTAFPLERYSGLWTKSPFESGPTVEAGPSFADTHALGAVVTIGSERFVTLIEKASNRRIRISDQAPGVEGWKIVAIETGSNPRQTAVTLERGSERGRLTYDNALLAQGGAPTPQQPQQVGQPGRPPNLGIQQQPAQPVRPPNAPPARVIRRRIIPSNPQSP